KGEAVVYDVTGDTLTAFVDDGDKSFDASKDRVVFTLTLAANGDYTFDLNDQLDHKAGSGDSATLPIDLSSVIVGTDADGDSVTPRAEAFVINGENDVPAIGPIKDGLVDFEKGDSVSNPLNEVVGADEAASVAITKFASSITYDLPGTTSDFTLLGELSKD